MSVSLVYVSLTAIYRYYNIDREIMQDIVLRKIAFSAIIMAGYNKNGKHY